MKKLLIICAIAVTVVSCSKQRVPADNSASASSSSQAGVEDRIVTPPATVSAAFIAKFGNVAVSQWGLRNDGTYRAHFMNNGVAWEATFTAAGVLVKSEPA